MIMYQKLVVKLRRSLPKFLNLILAQPLCLCKSVHFLQFSKHGGDWCCAVDVQIRNCFDCISTQQFVDFGSLN